MTLSLQRKAGEGLIWVAINLVMSQEAPMQPASKSEAAHVKHGNPTQQPTNMHVSSRVLPTVD